MLNKILDKVGVYNDEEYDWSEAPVICEINGYRWLLGPEADEALTWKEAKNWCESVGGELPPRDVLLHAYLNEDTKPAFRKDWYWSATESDATHAWTQHFGYGSQHNNYKTDGSSVRVVKRMKI